MGDRSIEQCTLNLEASSGTALCESGRSEQSQIVANNSEAGFDLLCLRHSACVMHMALFSCEPGRADDNIIYEAACDVKFVGTRYIGRVAPEGLRTATSPI